MIVLRCTKKLMDRFGRHGRTEREPAASARYGIRPAEERATNSGRALASGWRTELGHDFQRAEHAFELVDEEVGG